MPKEISISFIDVVTANEPLLQDKSKYYILPKMDKTLAGGMLLFTGKVGIPIDILKKDSELCLEVYHQSSATTIGSISFALQALLKNVEAPIRLWFHINNDLFNNYTGDFKTD